MDTTPNLTEPQTTEVTFRNRKIEDMIKDLRAEVAKQKECITSFTYQTMALAGALWAIAFKSSGDTHSLAFSACGVTCCALAAFMMSMISRMANHKYHTVNRNLGYELHIYRIKDYFSEDPKKTWANVMHEVGWEEAMCAARVVQASLFNYLYTDKWIKLPGWVRPHRFFDLHWLKPDWLKPYSLKVEHDPKSYLKQSAPGAELYTWYDTNSLIKSEDNYHPGNFLRNIHFILHGMGAFSIFLMWVFYVWAFIARRSQLDWEPHQTVFFVATGLFILVFTAFFASQVRRQGTFRKILESGILSIQSSAVVWRVVVTCHVLGKECAFYKTGSYMSYTRYTYGLAQEAKTNFYRIHKWLKELEMLYAHQEQAELYRYFDGLFPNEDEPKYLEHLP